MVITKKRALSLASSISVVKDIPEFIPVYEQFKLKNSELQQKRGCSSCEVNSLFADVSDQALAVMTTLSEVSKKKLKEILGSSGPIYVYSSGKGGVNMRRID
jgi:hypothetical protein